MTTVDEVSVRIGVDNSKVERDLKTTGKRFEEWARGMSSDIDRESGTMAFLFENSFKRTFHSLRNLFAVNILAIAGNWQDIWDKLTKWMGDTLYDNISIRAEGTRLEKWRQLMHSERVRIEKERAADWAAIDAAEKQAAAEQEERANLRQKIEAADTRIASVGTKERTRLGTEEYILRKEQERLKIAYDKAKEGDDEIARLKAELQLQEATLSLEQKRYQLAKLDADQANAAMAKKRDKVAEILGTGAFAGELREVARLRSEAGLAVRAGNISFAQTDLAIANSIMRSIQQRIAPQLNIPGKPEDLLKNQLIDALAPIKNPDGSLKVTVTNVE